MRIQTYIFPLLAVLLGLQLQGQESPADLGVAAIGLVVSDIDASERFYNDILGMQPAGSFSLDEQWSEDAGAANDKSFSVKMFKLNNSKTATVLKLAYFDKVKRRPKQYGINEYAGVNYITLNYNDLKPVADRLEKAGIKKLGWVKRDTYQLFFVRDPDGVFIELVGPPD